MIGIAGCKARAKFVNSHSSVLVNFDPSFVNKLRHSVRGPSFSIVYVDATEQYACYKPFTNNSCININIFF